MKYVLLLAQVIPHVETRYTVPKSDFWFFKDPPQKPLMYIELIYMYISFDRAHRTASNDVSFNIGLFEGENS